MKDDLDLMAGDRVSWMTPRGKNTGTILRKSNCRLSLNGEEYEASPSDPRFIVRADRDGLLHAPRAAELARIESARAQP
ncbi:MAG TPA: DUF2945 domain-containing protein [Caulobacterales bacterium]|nr:DUF2945 domain-containing protein [Caulobacterales bacterium]